MSFPGGSEEGRGGGDSLVRLATDRRQFGGEVLVAAVSVSMLRRGERTGPGGGLTGSKGGGATSGVGGVSVC